MTDPLADNEQRRKSLIDNLGPTPLAPPPGSDALTASQHYTYDNPADAARGQAAQQAFDANRSAAFQNVSDRQSRGILGASDAERSTIDTQFDPMKYGARSLLPGAMTTPGFAPGEGLPSPTLPKPDTSSWKTNGYEAPKYTPGGPVGPLAGWDAGKWNDTAHQTPKYAVGRILAESGAPSVENLDKAFANIEKAYPGAQRIGRDKIRMPDGGVVDVLTNSGAGQNMGWAWQPETGPGGAPLEGAAPQGGGMGGTPMPDAIGLDPSLTGSDPLAAIQAALAKYGQGNRPNLDALLAQLG